ncbi:MAG TPA: 30S ribosomal protein S20 [Vicinamibacteria bacterium]|nr:30S ribosomal protein S20 [Vicinamibacteria bacterium]
MAKKSSALKARRQSEKHRERNRRNVSQLKTSLKKVRAALDKGDAEAARRMLDETVSEIDRAARKGVVHDNAAARYKSRLQRRINALAAPPA